MHTSFVNKNLYPFKQRDKRLDERCVSEIPKIGENAFWEGEHNRQDKFQETVEITLYPVPVRAAK